MRRQELQAYADAMGLETVSDVSNSDRTYFRNRLRHELLPVLETYNPKIGDVLCRTAEALAGDHELLERAVQEAWERTVVASAADMVQYDRGRLTSEAPPMQRALLRRGVQLLRSSLRDLSWAHIAGALAVLHEGRVGARATLPSGLLLTLGYDRVLLADEGVAWPSDDRPRVDRDLSLAIPGSSTLPNGRWRVVADYVDRTSLPADWCESPGPYHAWLDADRLDTPVVLRPRRRRRPTHASRDAGVAVRQGVDDRPQGPRAGSRYAAHPGVPDRARVGRRPANRSAICDHERYRQGSAHPV